MDEEAIATELVSSSLDLFIGGVRRLFERRADGCDLVREPAASSYQVVDDPVGPASAKRPPLAGLVTEGHLPAITEGRGPLLPDSTSDFRERRYSGPRRGS